MLSLPHTLSRPFLHLRPCFSFYLTLSITHFPPALFLSLGRSSLSLSLSPFATLSLFHALYLHVPWPIHLTSAVRKDKLDNYYIVVVPARTSRGNPPGASSCFIFPCHFYSFTGCPLGSSWRSYPLVFFLFFSLFPRLFRRSLSLRRVSACWSTSVAKKRSYVELNSSLLFARFRDSTKRKKS